jgi:hypothetical protein
LKLTDFALSNYDHANLSVEGSSHTRIIQPEATKARGSKISIESYEMSVLRRRQNAANLCGSRA